LQLELGLEL